MRRTAEGARSASRPTAVVLLFYLLPFVSGAIALIYEITWAKMLALTFGSTTLSASAVVGGFMGGMGIGAWLYHLLFANARRPLVVYAALELGIAVSAGLLSLTFYSLPQAFASLSESVGTGPALMTLRFVSVFAILLIPSALMGATFPALCTAMIRTARGVDRHLGMIYGVNTIGAAFGVLFAGLVLVERIGLGASVIVANVLNVVVACAALALTRVFVAETRAGRGRSADTAIPTEMPRWLTGTVLFVSGFTTLGYEIVWFRASRYLFGNSTYALTTVLFLFLAGLGLGSIMLRRILKRASAERDLILCQCAIGVFSLAAVCGLLFVLRSPALCDHISIFSGQVKEYVWWWRLIVQGAVAVVTMLPATLFMGLSFPLASRLFLGDVTKLESRVGSGYLLANLGSILGSVLGAIVLLPYFGTIGGTKVLAATSVALAGLIAIVMGGKKIRPVVPLAGAAVTVAVAALLLPRSLIFAGDMYQADVDWNVVHVEEGDLATVQVIEEAADPDRRMMAIDGYPIGFSAAYLGWPLHRKQVLLAHLPMVLDTRIRRTLNVGLGSASTLHALAAYPQLETLDCVEINRPVVRASRLFDESVVLDDPRVTVTVDDAVHYLLRSQERYDLIVSDGKQQISFSGNASLLCREFYQYSRDRLSDHGMFVQWIPMTVLASDLQINLRTLCEVFPHVNIFYYARDAVMMVASRQALAGRPRMEDDVYRESPAFKDMDPYFFDLPVSLLSHWASGKRGLQEQLGDGPMNTWDHLRLEYSAFKGTREAWLSARYDNLSLLLAAGGAGEDPATAWGIAESPPWRAARQVHLAFQASFRGDFVRGRSYAEQAVAEHPTCRNSQAVLAVMRDLEAGSLRGRE